MNQLETDASETAADFAADQDLCPAAGRDFGSNSEIEEISGADLTQIENEPRYVLGLLAVGMGPESWCVL